MPPTTIAFARVGHSSPTPALFSTIVNNGNIVAHIDLLLAIRLFSISFIFHLRPARLGAGGFNFICFLLLSQFPRRTSGVGK